MTNLSQLAVASVIQRCPEQHAEVLGIRYEVLWPDGTKIYLHPVRHHGAPATLLRGVHHAGRWWLVDLERLLTRSECEDIKQAPERDQVGLVMYALRRGYHNAAEMLAKAVSSGCRSDWAGTDREAGSRPTRTGRVAANLGA